jgi:plasmid stabilization system protein ParE
MLPIIWRSSASADLLAILRYVAMENPTAARRLKTILEAAILPTAEHPYLSTATATAFPVYGKLWRIRITSFFTASRRSALRL